MLGNFSTFTASFNLFPFPFTRQFLIDRTLVPSVNVCEGEDSEVHH
ncbi:hypothetical protein H1P_2220008 [Hyella patelloides LEGE 07179]|uniref:Uncharacterized protein n=1 Tax=Hyella patelloides LEGE 07179 TaxID=945734 RepID=A0A563VR20_9CYAN|nr:hypothetical protein H1P_2220008 [Hyella patelloides LEGE 07179]